MKTGTQYTPRAATAALGLALALLAAAGCDQQRINELEEGVATEADVRLKFGEPERIWDDAGGARTLEYPRQPSGHRNYMITIGPDGKMTALRQVLTPENFAKVQPGMTADDVRRLLGKPAKIVPYALKNEIHFNWRYLEPPNTASMQFTAVFSPDYKVRRTESGLDPDSPELREGR